MSDRLLLDYESAMDAMKPLERRTIEIDTIVVNPGTPESAGTIHGSLHGVLRRRHPFELEEFWWVLPEATYFECGAGSFYVPKDRFRGAEIHGGTLMLDLGSRLLRIVPLVRSDALSSVPPVRSAPQAGSKIGSNHPLPAA